MSVAFNVWGNLGTCLTITLSCGVWKCDETLPLVFKVLVKRNLKVSRGNLTGRIDQNSYLTIILNNYWLFKAILSILHLDYLISPLINDWHVDIINKHSHFLACWWTVCCAHSFVHITLDGTLFQTRKKRIQMSHENCMQWNRLSCCRWVLLLPGGKLLTTLTIYYQLPVLLRLLHRLRDSIAVDLRPVVFFSRVEGARPIEKSSLASSVYIFLH